jgi:hypothetical protein
MNDQRPHHPSDDPAPAYRVPAERPKKLPDWQKKFAWWMVISGGVHAVAIYDDLHNCGSNRFCSLPSEVALVWGLCTGVIAVLMDLALKRYLRQDIFNLVLALALFLIGSWFVLYTLS